MATKIQETIEQLRKQLWTASQQARSGNEMVDVYASILEAEAMIGRLKNGAADAIGRDAQIGIAGQIREAADAVSPNEPVHFEGPDTGFKVRVETAAETTTYDYDRLVEVIGRHRAARLVKRTVVAAKAANALSADEQRRAGKVRVSKRAIKGVG